MIEHIEVRKIGKEKVLAVYLDFSLEVGSMNDKDKKDFFDSIKEYLSKLKEKETYQKVFIVVGGIVIATMLNAGGDFHIDSTKNAQQLLNRSVPVEEIVEMDVSHFLNDAIPMAEANDFKQETDLEVAEQDNAFVSETEENKVIESIAKDNQISNEKETSKVITQTSSNATQSSKQESVQKEEQEVKKEESQATQKEETNQDASFGSSEIVEQKQMVTVYRSSGVVVQIELEEYIVGVVAAEMPASFSSEALKAQSVVARTYALKRISNGQKLTDTVSTQAYIDINQMKTKWGSEFSKYYNKIKNAVSATTGQYITYQGSYINAVYHSTSNGYTEDAINVWNESYPYLKSVESSWDKNVNSYQRTITKDYQNLLDITGLQADEAVEIKILSRNASGRVQTVQVGDKTYTGVEFRNLFGLRSADFDIEVIDGIVQITTRGYGHGVGMSQYGANEMAKLGYNYKQIITYYYTGVQIQK